MYTSIETDLTVQMSSFFNGEVLEVVFTGPYSFCSVWKMFVQIQFQTRYSGRTLSRLRDFGHNMTKQVGFPTVRRKGSDKVKPSMAYVLHILGGCIHLIQNISYVIECLHVGICISR